MQTCPALVGGITLPQICQSTVPKGNLDQLPAQAGGTSFHSQPEHQGRELVKEFIKTIYEVLGRLLSIPYLAY